MKNAILTRRTVHNEIHKLSTKGTLYKIVLVKYCDKDGIIWEDLDGRQFIHQWRTKTVTVLTANGSYDRPVQMVWVI